MVKLHESLSQFVVFYVMVLAFPWKKKSGAKDIGHQAREKTGNLNRLSNVKVLPSLRFNLMISVTTRMPYQGVREISPRSGKSQGKMKVEKRGHPVKIKTKIQFKA